MGGKFINKRANLLRGSVRKWVKNVTLTIVYIHVDYVIVILIFKKQCYVDIPEVLFLEVLVMDSILY